MRLVYFGTPDDAVPPLDALLAAGHDVAFVVTQPDRRRTRGKGTDPTPVKQAAIERGLPVYTPEKAREVVDEVAASGAEIGVVVAFGQLLPDALFEAVPLGFVNIHFSLLPRWRGAAPVERAILAGDVETGVGLMQIDTGLDTGPVFAQARVPIEPDDTAGTLRGRLVALGSALLVENLPRLAQMTPLEQDGEPTYADKLDVEEFQLDPNQPAASWPASCARVRLAPARGSSRVASASRSIARRRSMRRCRSAKSTRRASWAPRRVRCNSTRSSPRASAPCAVPTGDAEYAPRLRSNPRERAWGAGYPSE